MNRPKITDKIIKRGFVAPFILSPGQYEYIFKIPDNTSELFNTICLVYLWHIEIRCFSDTDNLESYYADKGIWRANPNSKNRALNTFVGKTAEILDVNSKD